MNLITRNTDYAIRAIVYIAKSDKDIVSTAELSKTLRLPRPFMRKIFQQLEKEGILKSVKGNKGGFRFTLPPEKVLLVDLIKIFQGKIFLLECLFKKKICPNIKTCLMRKKIKDIEKLVIRELRSITMLTLLKGV